MAITLLFKNFSRDSNCLIDRVRSEPQIPRHHCKPQDSPGDSGLPLVVQVAHQRIGKSDQLLREISVLAWRNTRTVGSENLE